MFTSIRAPSIALRIGLAVVFLWFGIHKFIDPQYWLDTWIPQGMQIFAQALHVSPVELANLLGIAEVLIASGIATGFFIRYFAGAGALLLVVNLVFHGFSETLVRDVGLLGALIALALWPERSYV